MIADMLLRGGIEALERGAVPDAVMRSCIRQLCRQRLRELESDALASDRFIESMRGEPVAPLPERANEQHYEVPARFYELVLGRRRKYSCGYWSGDGDDLDAAEENALALTCERAQLADGQDILELGCGWGSLTLFMAERFPGSRITAVSNSGSQRAHIEGEVQRRGLENIRVVTADMNDFEAERRADRIVSVEMFEHMRNYEELLRRIATWLQPDGRLFVHIFCHRRFAYPFEVEGPGNWMGRHFFTGGLMPSADLLSRFTQHLAVTSQWFWDGTHYQRTAEAWLQRMDEHADAVRPILAATYGADAARWRRRWRLFFMACAELFGFDDGQEWQVTHALLERV